MNLKYQNYFNIKMFEDEKIVIDYVLYLLTIIFDE